VLVQDWMELGEYLADHGRTYQTQTIAGKPIHRPRPEVAMRGRILRDLVGLLQEFGLTASSRARLHVPPLPEDDGRTPGRKE
jgi:phage terminase small subunit